jgi:ABC-type transporter Mla subunit MlaD
MIPLIEKNLQEFVGAVFFIALFSIGYFTIVKKNIIEVKEPRYMPVILESAESLKIGSTVTLLGVPIGIIGSLHYILIDLQGNPVAMETNKFIRRNKPIGSVQGQFVIAILDLTRDAEMYSNYSIVTQYPTIFTVKTIDIRPGKKRDGEEKLRIKLLTKNEVMAFRTEQKIPVFTKEDVVLHADNFGDPLFLITEIIGENRFQIRRIIRNLTDITDKINTGNGNLSALLNRKGLEKDSVKLLQEISILSQELGDGLEAYRETGSLIDTLKILLTITLAGAGI